MRLLLAFVFSAAAFAQTPPFEIHGVVSEPGSGPIAGARVYARPNAPTEIKPSAETYSDAHGKFTIRISNPGSYSVAAEHPGYIPDRISSGRTIDATRPNAEINLQLFRPATVTGRVVDAESREPVEGVLVNLTGGRRGSRIMVPPEFDGPLVETRMLTDRNGIFTFAVMPVDSANITVVAAPPQSPPSAAYDAEAFKIVDQEIETSVPPLPLAPGASVHFGDILLKKIARYRVHVSLPLGDCPQGESVRIYTSKPQISAKTPAGTFVCGSEALLRGFAPGHYSLYAVSDWQGERDNIENAVWGTGEFIVKDENIETTIALKHGIVVEGSLIAADGLKSMPERLSIGVQPTGFADGLRPPPEQFIEWRESGRFRMVISPRPQTLVENSRSANAYIKQIFYNGVPQRDSSVPLNADTDVHHLEIVLDDKFASLIVTTEPDAYVYIWREGEIDRGPAGSPLRSNRWAGLIPGDYRVLALSAPILSNDLTARGEKVTLRAGETETFHAKAISASK